MYVRRTQDDNNNLYYHSLKSINIYSMAMYAIYWEIKQKFTLIILADSFGRNSLGYTNA